MTFKTLYKKAPMTLLLLLSFVGLFAYQVLFDGINANTPESEDLIKWGANVLHLTLGYEPWRMVTSGFLHIGLMHLMFNGYAMYYFGQVAEPMLGTVKFLGLFLLSVVGGNMLNSYITFNDVLVNNARPSIAAGASGGIMGIGMALLIFALFKVKVGNMRLDLKGLLLVMGINLMYGFFVPGIDNAGHIGGALTGGLLALAFASVWRGSKILQNCFYWLAFAIISVGFYWAWLVLHQQIVPFLA